MSHIVRIGPDWLRIPMLCLVWPWVMACYVGQSCMPVQLGGHPDKRRLLCFEYWLIPCLLFWAAWDGYFVPEPTP